MQGIGFVWVLAGKAGLQCVNEPVFDGRCASLGGQAEFHPRPCQRRRQVDGVERLPRLVVVRSYRVGDAPAGDREVWVEVERALEALDRFVMVERVGPDHPAVEPHLRLRRRRLNRPVIGPQVVIGLGLARQV
jgi:hypothetical protein